MTRRRPVHDAQQAAAMVDQILRLGYFVQEFSEYHVRIQDAVDFWPTAGKWRAPKGYKFDREGAGLSSLKDYLARYHPLTETNDAPKDQPDGM
jgi:hypothetical protein